MSSNTEDRLIEVLLDRINFLEADIAELKSKRDGKSLGGFAALKAVSDNLMHMGSKYGSGSTTGFPDLTGKTTTIDGAVFTALIASGYSQLAQNKDELNRINVFPVPDADTGNNMKIALRGGVLNLMNEPQASLQDAVDAYASDTLLSGQGNSGTVLSHFFTTLSSVLRANGSKASCTIDEFATALQACGESIGAAFSAEKLKEGTIVSVVRKGVQLGSGFGSLSELVTKWEAQSKTALYQTPDELEVDGKLVLKEAGVDCDSGAKGFYYLTLGMLDAMSTAVSVDGVLAKETVTGDDVEIVADHGNQEKFKYCTECVVQLKEGSTKEDVEALMTEELGDSLVCVSAPTKNGTICKVHIHTDRPGDVFKCCQQHNFLDLPLKEKSDDMDRQVRNARRCYNPEDFKVTFIFDSTAITEPWAETGVAHVPIVGMIKGEPYPLCFDPPSLSITEFLNKSRHEEMPVGSAAPPAEAFKRLFEAAIPLGKPIICVVLSALLSRTYANAMQAVSELPEEHRSMVTVIDHGYMACCGATLGAALVERAAAGDDNDQLVAFSEKVLGNVFNCCFLNATSVRRLAKHGRVPAELGEKLKGVPDAGFCLPLGKCGGRDQAPADMPGRAGTLKAPALLESRKASNGAVMGAGADKIALVEYLEILRDNLKPNQVLRNFHVATVSSNVHATNDAKTTVEEILGAKIIGDVEILQPILAYAIIAAWGSVFITYWVDEQ